MHKDAICDSFRIKQNKEIFFFFLTFFIHSLTLFAYVRRGLRWRMLRRLYVCYSQMMKSDLIKRRKFVVFFFFFLPLHVLHTSLLTFRSSRCVSTVFDGFSDLRSPSIVCYCCCCCCVIVKVEEEIFCVSDQSTRRQIISYNFIQQSFCFRFFFLAHFILFPYKH